MSPVHVSQPTRLPRCGACNVCLELRPIMCTCDGMVQLVFAGMGYIGWTGLTAQETRAKAQPFREEIKNEWARLRRAMPEMQSAAKPFVKAKWDENAYFLVQVQRIADCICGCSHV